MDAVNTDDLVQGTTAEASYFSADGELLIAKGTAITPRHIDVLRRRNIFTLFARDPNAHHELERILSKQFKQLEVLDIEEPDSPNVSWELTECMDVPLEIRQVKSGQEGLVQLVRSAKVADIDAQAKKLQTSDKPAGMPLRQIMTQMPVEKRTPEHKRAVEGRYAAAISDVAALVQSIGTSSSVDGERARSIVGPFMQTMVVDRDVVLNVAGIKHAGTDYICHHMLNVSLLAMNIAAAHGYSERQVLEIGMAGLLHDVGMFLIPPALWLKKGRLTSDEWFEVQKHPILGLHLLERVRRLPQTTAIAAYQSHERENGKGYARNRNGRLIHRYAKIVACADVFEAYCSPRTHRTAQTPYKGMETIVKMAREGFLAPDVVKSFLTCTSLFPVGSIVELSDRRIGRVVRANGASFTKPEISILIDERGRRLAETDIYQTNLKNTPDTQIVRSHPYTFLEGMKVMAGF